MVRTSTAIETNEDGSITYFTDDKAGYIPLMSEGKIPEVWPEDIAKEKYKLEEIGGWKISLYGFLENSILDKLYIVFQTLRAEMTGKQVGVPGGLSSNPFWSRKLEERRLDEHYNSLKKHDSLVKFLKNSSDLGQYIWIDGQPLYKLEEGKYLAVDYNLSRDETEEKSSQEPDSKKVFDADDEDFEDYLNKEWSIKEKDSERRISE